MAPFRGATYAHTFLLRQVRRSWKDEREDGQMPRERDLLWEALVEVCGADSSEMTNSERGRYNKALKELKEVNARPEDIKARAGRYRMKFPGADLTPTALVAHWSALKSGGARPNPFGPGEVVETENMQHWLRPEAPVEEQVEMSAEERAANLQRFRALIGQQMMGMPDE